MFLDPEFIGALVGSVIGVLLILGGIFVWVFWTERRDQDAHGPRPKSAEEILEQHLEEYLVKHFADLFPGWQIFDQTDPAPSDDTSQRRPLGVRYRTKAGEIDMLCLDPKGSLVVVELKRDKAPDRVIAQVDRYMVWVRENLAQPGQRVYGLIIAKRFDSRLFYTLQRRRDIKIWTYQWRLKFDKRPKP